MDEESIDPERLGRACSIDGPSMLAGAPGQGKADAVAAVDVLELEGPGLDSIGSLRFGCYYTIRR